MCQLNNENLYEKFENNLCELAQKNLYAKRVENTDANKIMNRTEYQRDWERIIHAKAFRRLENKAQIYTLAVGDHFRTRLTHTLEVVQIGRGIARELDLNEDLVEAIALGHDLGHTPFGHVGERTLDEILADKKVEGGFKHNYQGVKVVNYLEEKYGEFEGLDLTYQVLEGILKHTDICKCDEKCNEKKYDCKKNRCKIDVFLRKGKAENLYLDYNFATTLEGQVVAVADEIAQRAHDLDDGISSEILKIDELLKRIEGEEILQEFNEKIKKSLMFKREEKRIYIDEIDIMRARMVSDIITYFIQIIVKEAKGKIENYKKNRKLEFKNVIIKEKLICFDRNKESGKSCEILKEITTDKILKSENVTKFDQEGRYVIELLFKKYHENPEIMPYGTQKRILKEIFLSEGYVLNKKIFNEKLKEVIKENKLKDEIIENLSKVLFEEKIDIKLDEIIEIDWNLLKNDKNREKKIIRGIVDFIAGMTDAFAVKQFKKIYLPVIN